MFENRGNGWWPSKPPSETPNKTSPYGIEGLEKMKSRERRYIRVSRHEGTAARTPAFSYNPNNIPQKPFKW